MKFTEVKKTLQSFSNSCIDGFNKLLTVIQYLLVPSVKKCPYYKTAH